MNINRDGLNDDGRVVYAFQCGTCGQIVVTSQLERGVVPKVIKCRGSQDCYGDMVAFEHPMMVPVRSHYLWVQRPSNPNELMLQSHPEVIL